MLVSVTSVFVNFLWFQWNLIAPCLIGNNGKETHFIAAHNYRVLSFWSMPFRTPEKTLARIDLTNRIDCFDQIRKRHQTFHFNLEQSASANAFKLEVRNYFVDFFFLIKFEPNIRNKLDSNILDLFGEFFRYFHVQKFIKHISLNKFFDDSEWKSLSSRRRQFVPLLVRCAICDSIESSRTIFGWNSTEILFFLHFRRSFFYFSIESIIYEKMTENRIEFFCRKKKISIE